MNVEHAIELIQIKEVKKLSKKKLSTLLTPYELDYCQLHKKRGLEPVAARIAAKKALEKIIPLKDWLEAEVQKDNNGKPTLCLSGKAKTLFKKKKLKRIALSLSHTKEEAIASLICQ